MGKETADKLASRLKIANRYALPRVKAVVVNVGVGKQRDDQAFVKSVVEGLKVICGQHPQERRAKMAVAGFSVRQGNLVGFRVTLRGQRREDFIERLVGATLPRIRDFRGVPKSSFDGQGNLSIGIAEHLAFPEINPEKTDVVFGVQITLVTTAKNDTEGEALFKAMGFPLVSEVEEKV